MLVVGAGGLGSPLMLYLAAAGVGTHRHGRRRPGRAVQPAAPDRAHDRPHRHGQGRPRPPAPPPPSIPPLHVEAHATRLTAANALDLIARYDIVCDGTDNFATRFLVADACVLAQRTLVSAAVLRFEGQLSVFKPHEGGPCYRCLYPEPPPRRRWCRPAARPACWAPSPA